MTLYVFVFFMLFTWLIATTVMAFTMFPMLALFLFGEVSEWFEFPRDMIKLIIKK
jgi:hypothetical protein